MVIITISLNNFSISTKLLISLEESLYLIYDTLPHTTVNKGNQNDT